MRRCFAKGQARRIARTQTSSQSAQSRRRRQSRPVWHDGSRVWTSRDRLHRPRAGRHLARRSCRDQADPTRRIHVRCVRRRGNARGPHRADVDPLHRRQRSFRGRVRARIARDAGDYRARNSPLLRNHQALRRSTTLGGRHARGWPLPSVLATPNSRWIQRRLRVLLVVLACRPCCVRDRPSGLFAKARRRPRATHYRCDPRQGPACGGTLVWRRAHRQRRIARHSRSHKGSRRPHAPLRRLVTMGRAECDRGLRGGPARPDSLPRDVEARAESVDPRRLRRPRDVAVLRSAPGSRTRDHRSTLGRTWRVPMLRRARGRCARAAAIHPCRVRPLRERLELRLAARGSAPATRWLMPAMPIQPRRFGRSQHSMPRVRIGRIP